MDANELLQKARSIEIKTRGAVNNLFAGAYHAAFKGRGMSFAEVREYHEGDDVRDIDWNVTARLHHPYIKVFEEERELTVMLLIDVSGSLDFGAGRCTQRELVTEIAATLALSASLNKDKVGVLLFSDHIEKYIAPQKGRRHILRIIRELLEFQPQSRRTDLNLALESLVRMMHRRCVAFVISDFLYERQDWHTTLQAAARKHDVIALHVWDRRMAELPSVGLLKVVDAETGHEQYIDTGNRRVREKQRAWWDETTTRLHELLASCRVNCAEVNADEDYVVALKNLFARRRTL